MTNICVFVEELVWGGPPKTKPQQKKPESKNKYEDKETIK
jgi:hypothetical protein